LDNEGSESPIAKTDDGLDEKVSMMLAILSGVERFDVMASFD
jgi:hypothetical protein